MTYDNQKAIRRALRLARGGYAGGGAGMGGVATQGGPDGAAGATPKGFSPGNGEAPPPQVMGSPDAAGAPPKGFTPGATSYQPPPQPAPLPTGPSADFYQNLLSGMQFAQPTYRAYQPGDFAPHQLRQTYTFNPATDPSRIVNAELARLKAEKEAGQNQTQTPAASDYNYIDYGGGGNSSGDGEGGNANGGRIVNRRPFALGGQPTANDYEDQYGSYGALPVNFDGGNFGAPDPGAPTGAPGTGNFGTDLAGFGEAVGPALGGAAVGAALGGPAGAAVGMVGGTMAQGLAEALGLSAPATSPVGGLASVAGNIAQTQMGMTPTSNPMGAIADALTGPPNPADQEDADQGAAAAAAAAAAQAAAEADNTNSMSEASTADAAGPGDDAGGPGGDGDFARGGVVGNRMDPRSLPGIHVRVPIERTERDAGGPVSQEDENVRIDNPIMGYHSSPHDFDQFDLSKIGTGEGNQMYGHGLYFAENPKVSGQGGDYWRQFFNKMKSSPETSAAGAMFANKFDYEKAIGAISSGLKYYEDRAIPGRYGEGPEAEESYRLLADNDRQALKMLEERKIVGPRTYEVAIHARPEEFMDWDKPLSQQNQRVRDFFKQRGFEKDFTTPRGYTQIGGDVYIDAAIRGSDKKNDFGFASNADRKKLSEEMLAAGIPGIKYLDAGSRDAGSGTLNYVVFHPKHLEIKRRYADGGQITPPRDLDADPAVQQALDVTRGYQDPPTKHIEDWQWKPLPEVQQRLGGMREIPSHVQAFGNYMDEIAKRAANEGLSARDLIKAYTITRASIQRRANDVDRVRAAGLDLPKSFTGKIRPEGAFGEWLHTRFGQEYLNSAERGEANEDAIKNAVKVMTPFGKHEKDIPDALRWAAANLPGKERVISTLVANAMRGSSEPAEWRSMAKDVRGIGPSKAGFLASLMGRGDQPTLDARQIIEHTGRPTSEAQAFLRRKGGEGATEAVERLSARQQAMNLELPEELKPYYQHLAHHAVWDKAADEVTTHEDVINAMRGAAHGGEIDAGSILSHPVVHAMRMAGLPKLEVQRRADGGTIGDDPTVQRALNITRQAQPTAPQMAQQVQPQATPTQYKSWADVPTINPQDLVGKRVFPIFADLTKAGSAFTGIDASQVTKPEQLYGGPGYPLLPESQEKGLAWAVEGKGRGSAKIRKDADYVVVSAMMPHSHQSNASFSNALMKNMDAYVRDKRLAPEDIQKIDDMIRRPTEQKELQGLQEFPGFAHPEAENFLRGISFEQRKRISNVLASKEAQALGAPNIDKITRETLDPEFSGVPSRHGMFLLEIPKGTEEQQLVNLKEAGLPEHPSYQYGIKGRIVGKFHHPVAPEILFKDWFDKAHAEASQKEKSNVRRAFDLAMPVGTVTQEIADMLPRHPRDIQSGKAARLALNAFNDQWMHTNDPVNKGGLGAADFSQALKNSDFSSTLTQYSADDINKMKKDKNFTGYKLKDGEVYFGLKRNTNYADDYGFEHPELSPNETALVSVVNNEPGAKGIGGAPVVLKAIQEGATALDCYAVPSQKHPKGFLPNFYSHFGFKELGRIPFDPQYVTQTQFDDMKHQWRKSGWDETMGMPSLVIMKWGGKDADRSNAVQNFVRQSSEGVEPGRNSTDVAGSAGAAEQGVEPPSGRGRIGRQGDPGGDRGAIRADRNARSADRFTRTLSEIKALSPEEARHFGLDPAEVEALRQQFLPKAFGGSTVDKALRLTAQARPMAALADLFQRQLRGK